MVQEYSIETSVGTLSGRIARPSAEPRGLILALHGGTYDSSYYDTGYGSLLEMGAALGFCVVAPDRPGYGAGAAIAPEHLTFAGQADLLVEAHREIVKDIDAGVGTFLVGHSIGGMIALQMAATGSVDVWGVEVSGIGARWRPGMVEMWGSFVSDAASISVPAEPHAQVMFGPAGSYEEARHAANADLIRPMSMPELRDVVGWTDTFAAVASKVSSPVLLTFPEHDNIWETDDDPRALAGSYFSASPDVEVELLPGAGHSSELHKAGALHCLDQLSFALRTMPA